MKIILLTIAATISGSLIAKPMTSNNFFDFSFLFNKKQLSMQSMALPSEENPTPETNDSKRNLLASIISEPENNTIHELHAETAEENSNFSNLIRRTNEKDAQIINFAEFTKGEVVLAKAKGRDAFLIQCLECSVENGGFLKIKYLHNGISNSYKSITIKLVNGEDQWLLETTDGILIQKLKIVSRKILGQVIGIDRIEINP